MVTITKIWKLKWISVYSIGFKNKITIVLQFSIIVVILITHLEVNTKSNFKNIYFIIGKNVNFQHINHSKIDINFNPFAPANP